MLQYPSPNQVQTKGHNVCAQYEIGLIIIILDVVDDCGFYRGISALELMQHIFLVVGTHTNNDFLT